MTDKLDYHRAWREAHKDEYRAYQKAWREEHKEEIKAYKKAHKQEIQAYSKAWKESHKEEHNAYMRADKNSLGKTKQSIRHKSNRYLKNHGTKIPGYEIHHCCSYSEPYKFIYCSKELNKQIHAYLREHNIEADSDHYEQIKHLLDDTVILYGI